MGLTLDNALNITSRAFVNDGEWGLHADYEKWPEGLPTHASTSRCRPKRPVVQPHRRGRPSKTDRTADAHLKRNATRRVARDGPPSEAVVAVTNGRLDGFAELAEIFGTWERIFSGQAERLARES
jgi:hypothetical protein